MTSIKLTHRFPLKALRTTTAAFLMAFIVACLSPATAETTAQSPVAVVDGLHKVLLETMQQADQLGFAGRVEKLTPVLNDSFDFGTIARIVAGRGWKEATQEQQEKFVDVFKRLSIATYASNFSGYSGESFKTLSDNQNKRAHTVKTAIVKRDGEKISLNYMLRENNGQWRIINVVAQGVSDLSLKRAEYSAVIKSEGFDSLTKKLDKKVQEMRSGS